MQGQAVLLGLGIGGNIFERRRNFPRPLGVELFRVFDKRARSTVIAPLAKHHRQDPKSLRALGLLLADLEKYPLRGIQVPLNEESPPQFDFLGDVGVRGDQRDHSTRLPIVRRLTSAPGGNVSAGALYWHLGNCLPVSTFWPCELPAVTVIVRPAMSVKSQLAPGMFELKCQAP
jgi:hypothetical protein